MPSRPRPRHARTTRPPPAPVPRRNRDALIATGLLVLVVLAYAPALGAGWIWDDDAYVTANATLRSLDGLRRIWLEPGAVPQYYPVTFTSLWVEYHLWGLAPLGYHLTNVLLHGLNVVLAWRVLRRLAVPGALFAAAVFAVHPVHAETVAWVTERKNLLSAAATLGALLAYLRVAGVPTPLPPAARRPAYLLALGLFVAAMLSKTVACTLPVVILVLVWWKRGRVGAADVVPLLPFLAVGMGLGLGTVWMETHHVGAAGGHWALSPAERVLVAGRALLFYAGKLFWPAPLVFVYPRWRIDAGAAWQWLFPAAALSIGVACLLGRARLGRGASAAVAAFAVTLAPALGFVDVYPMRYSFVADHFQYLGSLALLALVAGTGATWSEGGDAAWRRPTRIAGAAVVVALGALLMQRVPAFHDARTLWQDTLAKNPGAAMAHVNLGLLLYQEHQVPEAVAQFEQALVLEPEEADVHDDLAIALGALGRTDAALAQFEAALARDPSRAETHNNVANLLAGAGRLPDAVSHYQAALRLRPRYADAENNLANALAMQGDTAAAVSHYHAALALEPGYADAHHNLGVLLAAAGQGDDALTHFAEAVRLRPDYPEAQLDLGLALVERGREPEAAAHYRAALGQRPGWPAAQRALAWVLATSPDAALRDGAQAVALATRACSQEGRQDAACLDTLAAAYAEVGRFAEAVATAEQALALTAGSPAPALQDAVRARIAGYRSGRPYRCR